MRAKYPVDKRKDGESNVTKIKGYSLNAYKNDSRNFSDAKKIFETIGL